MLKTINSLNAVKLNSSSARVLLTSKQDTFINQINQQSVRYARGIKPWKNGPIEDWKKLIYNYEYRRARGRKIIKFELPNFDENRGLDANNMNPDEIRTMIKKKGIVPHRKWLEKPIYVGDSTRIMDDYVPPEGDGKQTFISKEGVGQRVDKVKDSGKGRWALRKVRRYIDTFDPHDFAFKEALDIYKKAHEALADNDMDTLYTLVTETCLPNMLFNADLKTIKWKYVKSIEDPRCVSVKCEDQDGIAFAQVTVRFHSQQILAIYDRFGRLIHGSEAILKDVLEFIVFENRVSSLNGTWKIHGKIQPDWLKEKNEKISYQTKVISQ